MKRPRSRKFVSASRAAEISTLPGQNFHFADAVVTPRGDGSFIVVPGKPVSDVVEVGSVRAAEMLGIGLSALRAARDSRLGQLYLRWRFTSACQRVLLWEARSVLAYKAATRSVGK